MRVRNRIACSYQRAVMHACLVALHGAVSLDLFGGKISKNERILRKRRKGEDRDAKFRWRPPLLRGKRMVPGREPAPAVAGDQVIGECSGWCAPFHRTNRSPVV